MTDIQEIWLEVIDKDGWQKKYFLDPGITFIGSDPASNKIHLAGERGGNVAARHAQLIVGSQGAGVQLINLSDSDIQLAGGSEPALGPQMPLNIGDGAQFMIGNYTLLFHGQAGSGERTGGQKSYASRGQGSQFIGLALRLPRTQLAPNQSLTGIVTVSNLGDQSGVQFDMALTGLEQNCYELEPGPLLSAGAEKEVTFRLYHRGHTPPAGEVTITIQASTPKAYLGEVATVSQTIEVLPLYAHRVTLLAPGQERPASPPRTTTPARAASPTASPEPGAGRPAPAPTRRQRSQQPPPPPEVAELWSAAAEPSKPETPKPAPAAATPAENRPPAARPRRQTASAATTPPPSRPASPSSKKSPARPAALSPARKKPAAKTPPPAQERSPRRTIGSAGAASSSPKAIPDSDQVPSRAYDDPQQGPAESQPKPVNKPTVAPALSSPPQPPPPKTIPKPDSSPLAKEQATPEPSPLKTTSKQSSSPPAKKQTTPEPLPPPPKMTSVPDSSPPAQKQATPEPPPPITAVEPQSAPSPPQKSLIWEPEVKKKPAREKPARQEPAPEKTARKTRVVIKKSTATDADDWWSDPGEPESPAKQKPVLKLKADKPEEKQPPAEPEPELPPEVEDWWADEPETS